MVAEGKKKWHSVNNRECVRELLNLETFLGTPESNPYKPCNHNYIARLALAISQLDSG